MNKWLILESAMDAYTKELEEQKAELLKELQEIQEKLDLVQTWYIKAEENLNEAP